jgi:hypothetical protein
MTIIDELLKTLDSIEANRCLGLITVDIQTFGEARMFLNLLLEKGFLDRNKPRLSLMDDNEVNFWWNLPEARLDIGFYGTGIYSYYAEIGDQKYGADFKRFDDIRLDQELLNILEKINKKSIKGKINGNRRS